MPHFSMVLCHFEIFHFPGNSLLELESKGTVLNRNSGQNSVNSYLELESKGKF